MRFEQKEVNVDTVLVTGRHRTDLGDLGDLVTSIEAVGLINPITITPDGDLIAGQRRLEAFKKLGHETIPARVVTDLPGAVERLLMERDENTARKSMRPSELVSAGRALERLEAPKAVERMAQAGKSAAPFRPRGKVGSTDPTFPGASGPKTTIVADALGMSPASYKRAKFVVKAAENPDLSPADRAQAKEALAEMDETGRILGAYNKVPRRNRAQTEPKPLPERIAPTRKSLTVVKASEQREILNTMTSKLSAIAPTVKRFGPLHPSLTGKETAQWVGGLKGARRAITTIINQLTEHTNVDARI